MLANTRLPIEWQMHGAQKRVLLAFLAAPDGTLTFNDVIGAAQSSASGESKAPVVRRHIREIKAKLGHLGVAIDNRWGEGYEMPAASREIIRSAIDKRFAPAVQGEG